MFTCTRPLERDSSVNHPMGCCVDLVKVLVEEHQAACQAMRV